MNTTKITLQKIAGWLMVACGAWRLIGLSLVHNYNDEKWFLRDLYLFNYITIAVALAMLFIGLALFSHPQNREKTGVEEKSGFTIAGLSLSGASMVLQVIDYIRIVTEVSGFTNRLVNFVPSLIMLATVVILCIIALTQKHPYNSPASKLGREQAEMQEQQERKQMQIQINYLQMRVRDLTEMHKENEQDSAN